jgi:hypothetical protein
MKKGILLTGSACLFMFASLMMSCGGGSHEEHPAADSTQNTSEATTPATEGTTTTTAPATTYACEMKCEGETTTHNEAGKCPKCGMEMKQTALAAATTPTTTTTTTTTTH